MRLLLLLPVAGAAFVAASPLPRPASVRPVLPRASVPVAVVPPPLAAALPPAVSTLRGGLLAARAPESLFNLLFLGLSGACAALVVGTRSQQQSGDSDAPAEKPEMVKAVSALKWRFLAVFWLYKMADWLQGPYFYDVYASKIINGVQVNSEGVARLFLMGFGSTAVFGAAIGGLVDSAGRKRGSLAFARNASFLGVAFAHLAGWDGLHLADVLGKGCVVGDNLCTAGVVAGYARHEFLAAGHCGSAEMVESQRGVVDVLQIGAHVGDSRASSAAEATLDPVFPWLRHAATSSIKAVLVEPVRDSFEQLVANYAGAAARVFFVHAALSAAVALSLIHI